LGLSLARRMVEAHGGHIDVTSVVGKGTEFQVRLPIAPLQAEAS
jgi:signal transduction histidine kinase